MERIKIGGNGHNKLTLKQRLVRYLLKDAHIDELHIGAHSIVIDGDVVKMAALATDPETPAEGWIWHLAGTTHKPRYHNGTENKDIGHGAAPGAHDLGGAEHTEDTLANLNTKVSDGDLDLTTATRTPSAHNLGGAEHNADTLANLNAKVSDATLDKNTDKRDPNVHAADHVGVGDPIQDATAAQKGLATDTQITKLAGIDAGADVTADNAPKAHKASHQTTGADELDLTGMKADTLAEKTGDAGVTVDTCLIKDGKAADSNLLEGSNKVTVQDHTPKAHLLGAHDADTLANLNAKVSDATLDTSSATRDPNSHDKSKHSDIDQSLLTSDNVAFAQVTCGDLVLKNGWRLTEHQKYGAVLQSPKGELYRLLVKRC